MRLFATDTINSKNYEAEAILELPTEKGAPFYLRIIQDFPQTSGAVAINAKGLSLYEEDSDATVHQILGRKALIIEYAFVPSSKGHFKIYLYGEEGQISWENSDQEGVYTISDFYGNMATFCTNTWEIKEILTPGQISLSDKIILAQNKLKDHVSNNGLNSQDPTLANLLGVLCGLHQHP